MKIWDEYYLPHSRTQMCKQLGTILLGHEKLVEVAPGSYGERWGDFLEMVQDMRTTLDTLTYGQWAKAYLDVVFKVKDRSDEQSAPDEASDSTSEG